MRLNKTLFASAVFMTLATAGSLVVNAQPLFVQSVGSAQHVTTSSTNAEVTIVFTRPVTPASGGNLANYTFGGGVTKISAAMMTGLPAATDLGVAENPAPGGRVVDNQCAVLTVSGLAQGATATITISGIVDGLGNTLATTNITFIDSGYKWAESGTPGIPGKVVTIGTNGFDIFSNGSARWANYDEQVLVYKDLTGDFDVQARVEFQDFSSNWGRAGIMAREALNVGQNAATQQGNTTADPPVVGTASRHADIHANPVMDFNENAVDPILTGANNQYESHARLSTGGQTAGTGVATPPPYPNAWVRLQRTGQDFHSFTGSDGDNWTEDTAATALFAESRWVDTDLTTPLPMNSTLHVGPSYGPEVNNINNTARRSRLFLYQVRFGKIVTPRVTSFEGTPGGFVFIIDDAATLLNPSSVKLKLNGADVTATSINQPAGTNRTTITYVAPTVFPVGTTNSVDLEFQDNAVPPFTGRTTRSFVVDYLTIPASYAVAGVVSASPGFRLKVNQQDLGQILPNTVARAERQLHGDLGPNIANTTPDASGYVDEPLMINYDQGNAQGTPGNSGAFNSNNGFDDSLIPGVPGSSSIAGRESDNIAMEILTYLQFPTAGAYLLSFNSDDGFRTQVGDKAVDVLKSPMVVQADVGKGASDVNRWVYVPQAGAYAFRTVWFEGGGGASLEWSVRNERGTRALINDTAAPGAVKAYRSATGSKPPVVTYAYPLPNSGSPYFPNDHITIEWLDGTTQVNTGSIGLSVNGTQVSAAPVKSGAVTKLDYLPSGGWASGSQNTITLVWSDTASPAVITTNTWSFSVQNWVTIPANAAIPASAVNTANAGFKIRTHKADQQNDLDNSSARALAQLAGAYGPNKLDLSSFGADGYFVETSVINYEQGAISGNNTPYEAAFVIPADAGNFFDTDPPDRPNADRLFPGEPITDAVYPSLVYSNKWHDNLAMEVLTVLNLQAGWYWTGVNSDDGFKLSFAANPLDVAAVVPDVFEGGKGASDVSGVFYVPQTGYYPCRLLWYEGGGGASIEWFMQNTTNYQRTLVNDVNTLGFVPAYQYNVSAPPASYVKSITPAAGAQAVFGIGLPRVGLGKKVEAVIVDGGAPIDQNSIKIKINGAEVTPVTKNKVGNATTVTYTQALPANTLVAVELLWTDGIGARSATWSFTTGPLPGNTFVIEAEDFNTGGGQTVANSSTMPYTGNAYSNLNAIVGIDFLRPHQADSPLYRFGETNSVPVPGYPAVVNVPMDPGPGDFDRGGWDMTVNYKIGWTGAGHWYNYTRTFPSGNYNVYAALSHGDPPTSASRVRGSLQQVTAGATTTNQTVVQLGTFDGPATGGWGANRLVPLMNGAAVASVPLAGLQTIRFTTDSGDYDFLGFVPASGPAQPQFNPVVLSGGSFTLQWTGTGTLQQTDSLSPPNWQQSQSQVNPQTVTPGATGTRFYRIFAP